MSGFTVGSCGILHRHFNSYSKVRTGNWLTDDAGALWSSNTPDGLCCLQNSPFMGYGTQIRELLQLYNSCWKTTSKFVDLVSLVCVEELACANSQLSLQIKTP